MKPIRVKQTKKVSSQKKAKNPQRWLLKAFIYLLVFINGMTMLTLMAASIYQSKTPHPELLPSYQYAYMAIVSFFSMFFLLNLAHLKKWGFWGYLACVLISIAFNLHVGTQWTSALLAIGSPILLFALLYMGGRRSAWHAMSKNKASNPNT